MHGSFVFAFCSDLGSYGTFVGFRPIDVSIRQATLGLAAALTGEDPGVPPLEAGISVAIIAVVIVGSFLLTTIALVRFEIRAGD